MWLNYESAMGQPTKPTQPSCWKMSSNSYIYMDYEVKTIKTAEYGYIYTCRPKCISVYLAVS